MPKGLQQRMVMEDGLLAENELAPTEQAGQITDARGS